MYRYPGFRTGVEVQADTSILFPFSFHFHFYRLQKLPYSVRSSVRQSVCHIIRAPANAVGRNEISFSAALSKRNSSRGNFIDCND